MAIERGTEDWDQGAVEGDAWLQRKISVLAPPRGATIGCVAELITRSFKEVEQYRVGIVNLQVQTFGYRLSQGTSSRATTISLPLSKGQITLGDDEHTSDIFLHSEEEEEEEGGKERQKRSGEQVCEILVTLQGDRGMRRAHPATHVLGQPREGDEMSHQRAALLDAALRAQGEDSGEVLSGAFHGTPARRAYLSFVNPRVGKVSNSKETMEQAAARVAVQISFLQREHRAMTADFLRNADAARAQYQELGLKTHELILVLDNIRSVYNVGSIFRSAETARLKEIVTCGITAHPPHEKLSKTALSSLEYVPTRHFDSTLEAVKALKAEGVRIYGMETTSRSKSYVKIQYPQPSALVLGNELTGICTQVMHECDDLIEIPTFGVKNSLNVASACPIVVFEVLRQWGHL